MNMPVQVARAAELAEQRQKELIEPVDTPEASSPEETPAPAPAPAPASAPASQESADAELRRQLELAEQRYRTLQGMYDADRERSQAQFAQLQSQLTELKQAPPAAPASPVSEQDAEKFDQETIDFVVRVATNVATSVAADLVNNALAQRLEPVQQTVSQVATHVQQTAQERYYAALDAAQPDWRAINVSQQFIQWLQNVDPMSGYQINALLQDAHQKMDVDRVSAIFAAFKGATGQPAQPAAKPQRSRVDERAAMVEPPRGGSSTPAQRGGGRTYTRADIAQFYRDVTAGRIDRSQAAAVEQDILKAQSEGRIVG